MLSQLISEIKIESLQDIDVCYAFVEFDDISGVQNAIKV